MQGPVAVLLPDGKRLHLQHGPIDLIIGADGDRDAAFSAAIARFHTILDELVAELPMLRLQMDGQVQGEVARHMVQAVAPHKSHGFVTPMASVAGAVADRMLAAMVAQAQVGRAYVNNGGDIAVHLMGDARFRMAIATPSGTDLGRIDLTTSDTARGIATSGQGGRSLSMGIADAVTVLARDAAAADVAATLIANAVDLPGNTSVQRCPAETVDPDSDLGARPVVTHVGALTPAHVNTALARGAERAKDMQNNGLIVSAALFLRGQSRVIGSTKMLSFQHGKTEEYA